MPPKRPAANSNTQMAEHLINVLSDTYVLTVKTQGYHWNVEGHLFAQLHEFFGREYEALFAAADDIAERIRALDMPAPGSMEAFKENSVVKETTDAQIPAKSMVQSLLKAHEQARERIARAAEFAGEIGDKATEDLMIGRLRAHDKTIWMLRSQAA